jgi:hypothetical protein
VSSLGFRRFCQDHINMAGDALALASASSIPITHWANSDNHYYGSWVDRGAGGGWVAILHT